MSEQNNKNMEIPTDLTTVVVGGTPMHESTVGNLTDKTSPPRRRCKQFTDDRNGTREMF